MNTRILPVVFAIVVAALPARGENTAFKFTFSPGNAEPGYIQVSPSTIYSKETGYGFDPKSNVSAVDCGGPDALRGGYVTSDKPIFFSVKLPEGNYKVTVTLGDAAGESTTTVKSEMRRLSLEHVK